VKRTSFLLRLSLALIVCLGAVSAVSPASAGGNRCTDRCADRYRYRKDVCKAIPFKRERHRCEDAAKRAKDECKRRCR
jgi:hypothetical protein